MISTQNMIYVENICPWVSNELLASAFSSFGEVKASLIFVTQEHDSLGSGIVAFTSKESATIAYRRCRDMNFVLSSSPVPVQVSLLSSGPDMSLGLPEILLNTNNPELIEERALQPRIINHTSDEYPYVNMWQKLFNMERLAVKKLKDEMKLNREQLQKKISHLLTEEERKKLRERMKGMERNMRYPPIPCSASTSSRILSSASHSDGKEMGGSDDRDNTLEVRMETSRSSINHGGMKGMERNERYPPIPCSASTSSRILSSASHSDGKEMGGSDDRDNTLEVRMETSRSSINHGGMKGMERNERYPPIPCSASTSSRILSSASHSDGKEMGGSDDRDNTLEVRMETSRSSINHGGIDEPISTEVCPEVTPAEANSSTEYF